MRQKEISGFQAAIMLIYIISFAVLCYKSNETKLDYNIYDSINTSGYYIVTKLVEANDINVEPTSINIDPDPIYTLEDDITIDDLRFIQYVDNDYTDVTDDQLYHIINVSNDTGVNPILIATIMWVESRGQSDVYIGDCRGYGGISSDCGDTIYDKYLNLGDYDHDMAFDPYINITLIGNTLKYLMTEPGYTDNIYSALQYYSGTKGEWGYINKVARKLKKEGGPTLDEIQKEFYSFCEANKTTILEE